MIAPRGQPESHHFSGSCTRGMDSDAQSVASRGPSAFSAAGGRTGGLACSARACRETDTTAGPIAAGQLRIWQPGNGKARQSGVSSWRSGSGVASEEVAGREHGCTVMACAVCELAVRRDHDDLSGVGRSFDPAQQPVIG